MNNVKKFLRSFGNIASLILLFIAVAAAVLVIGTNISCSKSGKEPFYLGYRPCMVLTGSMEPYMMTNGIFIMKEVNSMDEIAVDDVVTYTLTNDAGENIYITHRIINISEEGIITTKGDNNNVEDIYELTIDNIIAKEVAVFNQPTVWLINTWNSGTGGKLLLASFAIGIIALFTMISSLLSAWLNDEEIDPAEVQEYTKLCRKLGLVPRTKFEEDLDVLRKLVKDKSNNGAAGTKENKEQKRLRKLETILVDAETPQAVSNTSNNQEPET